MGTLGILDEVNFLISDKLQVVSYKWLSRNFLVSSDAAKRLLQEFVKTRGNSFQVVYTVSGWMKDDPPRYQIKLVSGSKLDEAKQKFDGDCSVHIYSVQSSIPKDPAALWNIESVQAEELFKQPSAVENCLRDNRFCGIHNSFVKRNIEGASASTSAPQPKTEGISEPCKTKFDKSAFQYTKIQPVSGIAVQSLNVDHGKTESHETGGKIPLPDKKKMADGVKPAPGNGASLVNLWGQSSTKSKPLGEPANVADVRPISTASEEAENRAAEAINPEDSDNEAQDVNFRRKPITESNRKRRVVFDYSDDEFEDAINLASPDLPKRQSSDVVVAEKPVPNEKSEDKPKTEEKLSDRSSRKLLDKHTSASRSTNSKISEKIDAHCAGEDSKENLVSNGTSSSPKRRKILKTRIDERGREVTEVVWEDEDTELKKTGDNVVKKTENIVANNSGPAQKKAPVVGPTATNPGGKGGNKKGGNKDPKQGNILSFFKRV